MTEKSDRELIAPASATKRVRRPSRARGIGSGWVVSLAVHGALLFIASRFVRPVDAQETEAPEVVTVLDLRATNFAPRAEEHVREARAEARGEIPPTVPAPLVEPESKEYDANSALLDGAGDLAASVVIASTGGSRSDGLGSTVSVTRLPQRSPSATGQSTNGSGAGDPRPATDGSTTAVWLPPEIDESPAIAYPGKARRASVEGQVKCRLSVSASGLVESVEIVLSSGFQSLDDAARNGLLAWSFKPATRDGVPCACVVDHVVTFRLAQASAGGR